jgi:hypothetical protein
MCIENAHRFADIVSKGFWRCCITQRMTGTINFVHRQELQIARKHHVSASEPVSVLMCEGRGTSAPVPEVNSFQATNRVGISLLSPENGNRFSFQNDGFSSYLEFRTMDKVHNPSDSNMRMLLVAIHDKSC